MRLSWGTGHRVRPRRRTPGRGRAGLAAALMLAAVGLLTGCRHTVVTGTHNFRTTDYTRLVDSNQGPGQVFLRYPLGRIGLWSTPEGEIADSVTRGLRLYPTVDQVTANAAADWRASVSASPSQATIAYGASSAARGSRVALTVTPDVSLYRYYFGKATSYAAVDLLVREVENSNVTWSASSFQYVDNRTAEVILSDGGRYLVLLLCQVQPRRPSRHGTFSSRGAPPAQPASPATTWAGTSPLLTGSRSPSRLPSP